MIIFVAIGNMSSCKSAKNMASSSMIESQKTDQKFYLMLRVVEEPDGKGVRIENMEKEVITDQNNPLPLPPSGDSGLTFRCEVLDINGQIVDTHEVGSEFKYGNTESSSGNIVKFIFRIGKNADSVRVSRELKDGVWEEILTTSIENEKTEESKK